MSDQETMNEKAEETPVKQESPKAPAETAKTSVKLGSILVLAVIVLSLVWYLLADRFTPSTTQARVEGYIVGVAPKVAGVLTEVWVSNNQAVEAEEPLFQIDPAHYQIAVDKAQSDLENAKRQVDAGNAAVEVARANLLAAQANREKAEKDTLRLERLYKDDPGTISVRRLEISQASREQAKAGVVAAEAEIRRAIEQKGGNDDVNNSILKTALIAVAKADLDLANTVVKASSRGMVTDLRADVGQFAGTGSPVLTLISLHDVWISAEFTENNLGHIKPGSSVDILFDVIPGRVFSGKVRSVGVGVSTGQAAPAGTLPTIDNSRDWLRQSQRFPVIIEFDVTQDAELRRQLRIGGQATVIAYTDGHGFLNRLGAIYIWFMSKISYAY